MVGRSKRIWSLRSSLGQECLGQGQGAARRRADVVQILRASFTPRVKVRKQEEIGVSGIRDATTKRPFVVAGLCSALLTLALGAFWLMVLVLGTGLIFAAILLTTDSLLNRNGPVSARTPFSRRMLAGTIVTLSYPCGVMIFIVNGMLLECAGINSRILFAICGTSVAGIFSSFVFYRAVKIMGGFTRNVFLRLLLVAIVAALVSGSSVAWGQEFVVLRPHWFVSPFWITLLLVGETGFAWVWGRARRPARKDFQRMIEEK